MKDRFNIIFASAVGLTVFCGTLMGVIALYGPSPQTAAVASVFETLKYGFTVGMLSVFGLLGPRSRNSRTRM
jgi:hypothetical protein